MNKISAEENPNLRSPYGVSGEKIICCGPCRSEPISVKFNIEKTAFVSGESISFFSVLENKTNRKIKPMTVKLIQCANFHTNGRIKESNIVIASIKYNKIVNSKSVNEWDGFLLVPPTCPTSNGLCKLIDIHYELLFVLNPSGLSFKTELTIPIIIGNG